MYVYKNLNKGDVSSQKFITYKTTAIDSSSEYIRSVQYISGSLSSSYWSSLRFNFYMSGSKFWSYGYNSRDALKFANLFNPLTLYNRQNPQYLTKFNDSGSIISIGQKLYGDNIRRGSFELKSNHGQKTVIIKDDGYGNLYSPNTHVSKSISHASSSDNYIGNIFYPLGIVTITETGSWSGSIKYTDVATSSKNPLSNDYSNFTLRFDSAHEVNATEYTVKLGAKEFNNTNNPTVIGYLSGSEYRGSVSKSSSEKRQLAGMFTSSVWSPYITTIGFYGDESYEPLIVARYPQPIKKRKDMEIIFKIRIDY